MSDAACQEEGSGISMCCYMNRCVPSSKLGCTNRRLQFYKHLMTKEEECQMKSFATELREVSEKVTKCDQLGVHCIDYVTELMTDPGSFELLDGVSPFSRV